LRRSDLILVAGRWKLYLAQWPQAPAARPRRCRCVERPLPGL